jgi:hypothetical protein
LSASTGPPPLLDVALGSAAAHPLDAGLADPTALSLVSGDLLVRLLQLVLASGRLTPRIADAFSAAAEAAARGDTDAQNRQMALGQGKQYEPFKAAGGGNVVLNAGTGETQVTDLGQAVQMASEALAGARDASAGASNARRDLTQRTDPNRSRSTKPKDAPAAPKAGDVLEGYTFIGGDPSDKKNWKKN